MKRKEHRYLMLAGILLLAFILFTVFADCFDVKPIGPRQSEVGFATVNAFVFAHIGVHFIWYRITEWIGYIAILFAVGFTGLGAFQLMKRKSIRKVDRELLFLGYFYLLLLGIYLLFELVVINYRPVLLSATPEPSYPSSHTMLVTCIMSTSAIRFRALFPKNRICIISMNLTAAVSIITTVIGRLLSGVHWFTDIMGAILLSSALIALYCAGTAHLKQQ